MRPGRNKMRARVRGNAFSTNFICLGNETQEAAMFKRNAGTHIAPRRQYKLQLSCPLKMFEHRILAIGTQWVLQLHDGCIIFFVQLLWSDFKFTKSISLLHTAQLLFCCQSPMRLQVGLQSQIQLGPQVCRSLPFIPLCFKA